MKNFFIFIIIAAIIAIIGVFATYNLFNSVNIKNLRSTDLHNILIENVKAGSNINDLNLDNYRKANIKDKSYKYHFEGMSIDYKNNKITKIRGDFDSNITISIRNYTDYSSIKEITDELGTFFNETWFDKEQGLKRRIYRDNENNILVSFIYSNNYQLIKIILESTN